MAVSTRELGLSPGLTNWQELIKGWNQFERIPDVYVPFHPHILSKESDKARGKARGKGFVLLGYLNKRFFEKLPLASLPKCLLNPVPQNFLQRQQYSIAEGRPVWSPLATRGLSSPWNMASVSEKVSSQLDVSNFKFKEPHVPSGPSRGQCTGRNLELAIN